jgi:hypothetical protein
LLYNITTKPTSTCGRKQQVLFLCFRPWLEAFIGRYFPMFLGTPLVKAYRHIPKIKMIRLPGKIHLRSSAPESYILLGLYKSGFSTLCALKKEKKYKICSIKLFIVFFISYFILGKYHFYFT